MTQPTPTTCKCKKKADYLLSELTPEKIEQLKNKIISVYID